MCTAAHPGRFNGGSDRCLFVAPSAPALSAVEALIFSGVTEAGGKTKQNSERIRKVYHSENTPRTAVTPCGKSKKSNDGSKNERLRFTCVYIFRCVAGQ